MYSSFNENNLILPDIADAMQDHVSIQMDIDVTRVKAASMVAQDIDISRLIGRANVQRCIDPQTEADEELKLLVIKPLCFYTYVRSLKMFQGTLTDSGYVVESEAQDRNSAKSVANEMVQIAETYMQEVVAYLEAENPQTKEIKQENFTPQVRVFGGVESRSQR